TAAAADTLREPTAKHRHAQQDVASPPDERSQATPFASEDQTQGAREVGVPRGDATSRCGAVDPNTGLFELFERCCQVRLARDSDRLGGAHRGLGRGSREPDLMMF